MADSFEATVKAIMERTGLGRDDTMALIRKKWDELGVVTLEGAACMVAKELEGRG